MTKQLSNIILIAVLFASCTQERQISRAVRRLGPKQVTAHIAKNYPEYLTVDTIRIHDTISVPFEVIVPEITYDTIIHWDTINMCPAFYYMDRNIKLSIEQKNGQTSVDYKIFSRTIKDTIVKYVDRVVVCPPCPTVAVVQEVKQKYEIQAIKDGLYKKGFWILILLIGIYLGIKLYLRR